MSTSFSKGKAKQRHARPSQGRGKTLASLNKTQQVQRMFVHMSNPWTKKCISKYLAYWLRRLLKQSSLWTSGKLGLIFIKGENQLSLRTSNANNHHFTKTSYTCGIQSMTRKCVRIYLNKKELLLWTSKNLKQYNIKKNSRPYKNRKENQIII